MTNHTSSGPAAEQFTRLATLDADSYSHIPHAITRWVIQRGISANAERLVNYIVRASWGYRHQRGGLVISHTRDYILANTGLSRGTYQRAAKELLDAGMMTRETRRHPNNPWQQGASRLQLVLADDLLACVHNRAPSSIADNPTQQQHKERRAPVVPQAERQATGPDRTAPEVAPPGPQVPTGQGERTHDATEVSEVSDEAAARRHMNQVFARSEGAAEWRLSSPQVRRAVIAVALAMPAKQAHDDKIEQLAATIRIHQQGMHDLGGASIGDVARRWASALVDDAPAAARPGPEASRVGATEKTMNMTACAVSQQEWNEVSAKVSRAVPGHTQRQRDDLIAQAAWAMTVGTFAATERAKAINSIAKLMRMGRWTTPAGYRVAAVQPANNGDWRCVAGVARAVGAPAARI